VTIEQIFQQVIGPAGGLFVLLLGAGLFFTGKLVNGDLARALREDALKEMSKRYEAQIVLMAQRYDEMQATWRERCAEQTRERDYYRALCLNATGQTEQALRLAQERHA